MSIVLPYDIASLGPPNISGSNDMNIAAKYVLALWFCDRAEQLNGFKIYCGSNTGSPLANVELWALDANLEPTGSALATITPVAPPTVNGMSTFTFGTPFTTSANTLYGVKVFNTAGTPGSNFFRLLVNAVTPGATITKTSVNSGSTWDSFLGPIGLYPNFNTSGTIGPLANSGNAGGSGLKLYNTGTYIGRDCVKYNFPDNIELWALAISGGRNKTGTPTQQLRAIVCSASAVLATSDDRNDSSGNNAGVLWNFKTPVQLTAGTDYYIGLTSDSGGDASNYFQMESMPTFTPTIITGPIVGGYQSTTSGVSFASNGSMLALELFFRRTSSAGGGQFLGGMASVQTRSGRY